MIQIRQAVPTDAVAIEQLHVATYKASYRGYLPDNFLDTLQVLPEKVSQIENAIIRHQKFTIAVEDEKIVAFASVGNLNDLEFEIISLYTAPNRQNQGIGSLLINDICQRKKAAGFGKCIVWTIKDGPSIGFYAKMGFISTSQEKTWKFGIKIVMLEKTI